MMFLLSLVTVMATVSIVFSQNQVIFFQQAEVLNTYVLNASVSDIFLVALTSNSVQIADFSGYDFGSIMSSPTPTSSPLNPQTNPLTLTGFNRPRAAWPGVDSTHFFVADTLNFVVRAVSTTDNQVTVFAGQVGVEGHSGDGGQATSAAMYSPFAGATNGAVVYIADFHSCTIRSVDSSTGIISTFFGVHRACQSDSSHVNHPSGLGTDGTYLYVSELEGNCILQISLSDATSNSYLIGNTFVGGYTSDGPVTPATTIIHPACLFMYGGGSGICFCERSNVRCVQSGSLGTRLTLNHPRGGWFDLYTGSFFVADPNLNEVVAVMGI